MEVHFFVQDSFGDAEKGIKKDVVDAQTLLCILPTCELSQLFPHQPLEVVQKDLIIKPENSLDLFTHIYYICARNSTPPRNMNLSYSWDHQANKSYCTAKLEQLYYMSSGTFFNWELLRIQFYWQLKFTEVSIYA